MSETYTVKQVAEILGYSTNSIYTFLKEKRIKGVRVGRGRFRITEEELQRLLHLSKKPIALTDQKGKENTITPPLKTLSTIAAPSNIHFDITSLFDWFAGGVSILVGASLFLFSKSEATVATQPFLDWIRAIQVSFILGGLGLIISDILTDRVSILWHRLFHLVLIFTFFGFGLIGLQIGDGGTIVLSWALAFVMILNIFRLLRGMESFLLFIILASCAMPLGFILAPELFGFPEVFEFMLPKSGVYFSILGLLLLVFGAILWWSHYNKRIIFWLCMGIYGSIFIVHSFNLANSLMWPKSFFMLFAGLSCFLVPAWESLHLHDHIERKTILPIFTGATAILLFSIGVIFVMEQNIKDYARREIANKAAYGEIMVDSTLNSIERMLDNLKNNQQLREALKDGDGAKADEVLKIAYEGNQTVRRLLVLEKNGDLVSNYPFTELTEKNFAFRDYHKEVLRTGTTFLSQIFESKTKEKRSAAVIAGPVLDEDGKVEGILAASIDLDRLGLRLQKMANEEQEEHFMLLDKNLQRIINPDRGLIGQPIESINILTQNKDLDDGIGEGYNAKGVLMLQAFHKIEKTGWYIELQAPMDKILSPTKAVSFGFFSLVSMLVFVIGIFVVVSRNRG